MDSNQTLTLQAGNLYILSGPPGCGKSSFLQNNNLSDKVVSSDDLRDQIFGTRWSEVDGELQEVRFEDEDGRIFDIMESMVEGRLRQHLTTFVDATSIDDKARGRWVRLAESLGRRATVLMFDQPLEQLLENNQNRAFPVSERVLKNFHERFQRDSEYAFETVSVDHQVVLEPLTLPHDRIDAVGDIHGLYDDLSVLLTEMGYEIRGTVPVHPDGRKLLFMGDFIDRGQQSIEVLRLVMGAVEKGGHFAIVGNHENKLINAFDRYDKEGTIAPTSFSSAETMSEMLKLDKKERKAMVEFMRRLPASYTLSFDHPRGGKGIAFCHADIDHVDPLNTPRSKLIYGVSNWGRLDSDAVYQRLRDQGINQYDLIRGHIPHTSEQACVFSLDREQAFAGKMLAVPLDKVVEGLVSGQDLHQACDRHLKTRDCSFDFKVHSEQKIKLKKELDQLVKDKLVNFQEDPATGMKIYKFSRRVFWDALWDEHPLLLRTRGLVVDMTGNIVQNPFTKVFNYGERDTGMDIEDDREVVAVEKLNGFMGSITKHPFRQDLLTTTTGSFDSDFVGYINDFIKGDLKHIYDGKLYGNLMRFYSQNDLTLLFEVIHPADPHIVKYEDHEMGLYLIGARGKGLDDVELDEQQLDDIAQKIGVGRPDWFIDRFDNVKRKVNEAHNFEGYMVRSLEPGDNAKVLVKFKTPDYLITKFLGRMSDKKIGFMFGNPQRFKEQVDEEFYGIVDYVTDTLDRESFETMNEQSRINLVRSAIFKEREGINADIYSETPKSDKEPETKKSGLKSNRDNGFLI